jgi:hypothetical protein
MLAMVSLRKEDQVQLLVAVAVSAQGSSSSACWD